MKTRQHYLDILKFIAIFCVCFYHFAYISCDLSSGFSTGVLINRGAYTFNSICVPMFMVVNGALMLNRKLDISRHYKKLAIFFLVFMVWRVITFAALGAHYGYDFSSHNATDLFSRFVLLRNFDSPLNADHFWFISMFIKLQFFVPLFVMLFQREDKEFNIIFGVTMAVLWFSCVFKRDLTILKNVPSTPLDFLLPNTLESYAPFDGFFAFLVFFFLLGGYLCRRDNIFEKLPTFVFAAGAFASLGLQTLIVAVEYITKGSNGDIVFNRYNTTTNILLCICLFMLAKRCEGIFEKNPKIFAVFETIGQNTISIFYLHWFLGKIILAEMTIPSTFSHWIPVTALIVLGCTAISVVGRRIPIIKYLFGYVPKFRK